MDLNHDGIAEDHWFSVAFQPLCERGEAVSGVIAVGLEVTDQVRARQELERANRELEEFAFVASHDMQEPLRMINSFTQLLVRRHILPENEEAHTYGEYVQQGVHRMEQLIQDLLAYSRVLHQGQQHAPVGVADLNASWTRAITIMEGRIMESGASVTADSLPLVRGETDQLAQVFQNLLSNALKYRKDNEPVKIEASATRQDHLWVIAVRDNGIGFEQRYAERIFGLFKRLHRDEFPGTGLGLAICQRIVERFGGHIWAESEPGVGSTFYFALPAAGE